MPKIRRFFVICKKNIFFLIYNSLFVLWAALVALVINIAGNAESDHSEFSSWKKLCTSNENCLIEF